MLQFAREHLLIFVDEHVNQKLSKTLDLKNRGMDTNKKNKQSRTRANQGADTSLRFNQEAEQSVHLLGQGGNASVDDASRGASNSVIAKG